MLNMNGDIFQLVYAQLAFYTFLCQSKGNLANDCIACQEEELKASVCLYKRKYYVLLIIIIISLTGNLVD